MEVRLRVISWNLHGTPVAPRVIPRFRAAAGEILRRSPDVVLLQEVWREQEERLLASDLGPGYVPVGAGSADHRRGGLLAFVSRASGWRVAGHRFETFDASGPVWKLWEGDGLAQKGMLQIRLERSGLGLAVFNTHLQAAYSPGGYAEVRRAQLQQLGAEAARIDPNWPLLVAGDLNTRHDTALFEEMREGFLDLSASYRERCACGSVPEGEGWIDYILMRRSATWNAAAHLDLIRSVHRDWPYSDHHGLDADIALSPTPFARLAPALIAGNALWGPSSRRSWLAAAATLLWYAGDRAGGRGLAP